MYICIYIYISIYLSIYLSISLYLSIDMSISILLCISVSIYTSLSIYLFIYLSLSIYLSFYLYVYLSIYLSIHLSRCVYLKAADDEHKDLLCASIRKCMCKCMSSCGLMLHVQTHGLTDWACCSGVVNLFTQAFATSHKYATAGCHIASNLSSRNSCRDDLNKGRPPRIPMTTRAFAWTFHTPTCERAPCQSIHVSVSCLLLSPGSCSNLCRDLSSHFGRASRVPETSEPVRWVLDLMVSCLGLTHRWVQAVVNIADSRPIYAWT